MEPPFRVRRRPVPGDAEPVSDREGEFAPRANRLHAARETHQDAADFGAPAAGVAPFLRAAFEHGGAVKAKIDEENDGADHANEEQRAGCFRGGLELRCRCARCARNCVRVRFEQHQAEAKLDHEDGAEPALVAA